MKILVINAGSSSLKCSLYAMPDEAELANGLVEKIGEGDSALRLSSDPTIQYAKGLDPETGNTPSVVRSPSVNRQRNVGASTLSGFIQTKAACCPRQATVTSSN